MRRKLCRSVFYDVLWGSNEQLVQNWQFPRVTKQSCSWNSYCTLTQCVFPTAQGGFAYSTDKMINIRVYAKLAKLLAKLFKHPTFPRNSWDKKLVQKRHTLWNISPSRPDKKEYQLKNWSLRPQNGGRSMAPPSMGPWLCSQALRLSSICQKLVALTCFFLGGEV